MMTFDAGAEFGDYTIEGLIAAGGMGQVYAARDKLYGSPVALKVLHRELHADQDWRLRFNLEGVIGQQLKHPHVVAARDLVESGDDVAIVLDLVSGGLTLQRVISREYPNGLTLVAGLKLFLGIVQGVEYAHGKMVIHGDIKPENVLIDGNYRSPETWVPKVTDFGTVGIMAHPVMIHGKPAVVVSPRYASPEHMQGIDHLENRSDVYSLGLLLHYLVTGHHACPANTVDEAALNVSRPVPLVGMVDQPENLIQIVQKATQREVAARYQSCRELAVAVRQVLDELGASLVLEDLSADLATEVMEERAKMRSSQEGMGDTLDPGAPITDGVDLNTLAEEQPEATDSVDLNTLAEAQPAAVPDVAPEATDSVDLNTLAEAQPEAAATPDVAPEAEAAAEAEPAAEPEAEAAAEAEAEPAAEPEAAAEAEAAEPEAEPAAAPDADADAEAEPAAAPEAEAAAPEAEAAAVKPEPAAEETAKILEEFGRDEATSEFFTAETPGLDDGTIEGAPSTKWVLYLVGVVAAILVIGLSIVFAIQGK